MAPRQRRPPSPSSDSSVLSTIEIQVSLPRNRKRRASRSAPDEGQDAGAAINSEASYRPGRETQRDDASTSQSKLKRTRRTSDKHRATAALRAAESEEGHPHDTGQLPIHGRKKLRTRSPVDVVVGQRFTRRDRAQSPHEPFEAWINVSIDNEALSRAKLERQSTRADPKSRVSRLNPKSALDAPCHTSEGNSQLQEPPRMASPSDAQSLPIPSSNWDPACNSTSSGTGKRLTRGKTTTSSHQVRRFSCVYIPPCQVISSPEWARAKQAYLASRSGGTHVGRKRLRKLKRGDTTQETEGDDGEKGGRDADEEEVENELLNGIPHSKSSTTPRRRSVKYKGHVQTTPDRRVRRTLSGKAVDEASNSDYTSVKEPHHASSPRQPRNPMSGKANPPLQRRKANDTEEITEEGPLGWCHMCHKKKVVMRCAVRHDSPVKQNKALDTTGSHNPSPSHPDAHRFPPKRSRRQGYCAKEFCERCLQKYPSIEFDTTLTGFECPACEWICSCSQCIRDRAAYRVSKGKKRETVRSTSETASLVRPRKTRAPISSCGSAKTETSPIRPSPPRPLQSPVDRIGPSETDLPNGHFINHPTLTSAVQPDGIASDSPVTPVARHSYTTDGSGMAHRTIELESESLLLDQLPSSLDSLEVPTATEPPEQGPTWFLDYDTLRDHLPKSFGGDYLRSLAEDSYNAKEWQYSFDSLHSGSFATPSLFGLMPPDPIVLLAGHPDSIDYSSVNMGIRPADLSLDGEVSSEWLHHAKDINTIAAIPSSSPKGEEPKRESVECSQPTSTAFSEAVEGPSTKGDSSPESGGGDAGVGLETTERALLALFSMSEY